MILLVLRLVLESTVMQAPIFEHERRDLIRHLLDRVRSRLPIPGYLPYRE